MARMNWFDHLSNILLLAQDPALPAEGVAPGAAGDGGLMSGFFNNPLLPLLVIGVMFYFLLIMPERRKRKELEGRLNELKKNDPVITSGGICGTVVTAATGSKFVTIRVDDSTKLKVLRSHITHIGAHDEAEAKDKKEGAGSGVSEK